MIKSFLLVLLISLGVGFVWCGDQGILSLSFLQGVTAAIITQFSIFCIIGYRRDKIEDSANAIIDEVIELQTVPITCPCKQYTFTSPIFLNKENLFSCKKCSSKFKVDLSYDSIIITEPINLGRAFDALKSQDSS